ncbi:MFS transporter [Saccharopolyspora rhizosphaerae]|uniref:MFS transporter n=1 Tax=Saccharopolyspora rhizosphaerae TaxID=2492662 RepID=A0A3R8P5K7_9PSEU|nr:MFS transporter [Saccharopolyspora rhizosphaerae]RRO20639.1 MFS transporter [Saccharopolyspora rhizosphaerae]
MLVPPSTRVPNRWLMLAVSMFAQLAATVFTNAAPALIPNLHFERGLSLSQAGLVAAAPLAGTMCTLIIWGAVVDRIGERISLLVGLSMLALSAAAAALAGSLVLLAVLLFLGGAAGASSNSASGRVVSGWFPPQRRGLAMGIRQTAQPLGVGLTAVLVPNLVEAEGLAVTMLAVAAVCAVAAVLVAGLIVDPPRPPVHGSPTTGRGDNPYRGDRRLLRIHGVSIALTVPQQTAWTYMLVWLISTQHWSTAAASALVGTTQLISALSRVGAGVWSDRIGDRLRPIRHFAFGSALAMGGLAAFSGTPLALSFMIVASIIAVAHNGLAFTAVAEIAGPHWSGRAMGAQNTGQSLTATAVPPIMGTLIAAAGYPIAFAAAGACALLAVPLVPVKRAEPRTTARTPRAR